MPRRGWTLLVAAVVVAASAAAAFGLGLRPHHLRAAARGLERHGPPPVDEPGTIAAAFAARSYPAGGTGRLTVRNPPRSYVVQLFHVGPGWQRTHRDDVMVGVPAGPRLHERGARSLALRLPRSASGLYFARLSAPRGRLGFAPIVLRPARLGTSRAAVVLPTNTWEAYNFRDDDGDGVGDTWYANSHIPSVDLSRPYLNRGVPPHYRGYDFGFLRWLSHHGLSPDFLADDDLERLSAGRLARLYTLVVFSGHEEYVTPHAYAATLGYRDRGGNLMFLSANNFFFRVERHGQRIYKTGKWRLLGRPEAALTGDGYVGWFENRFPNRPYTVVGTRRLPWLFAGTGLRDGSRFGNYGIEIDQRTRLSPPGTRVAAAIPNAFGRKRSAEMTYYETPRGAKVFSAGVMNFGGSAQWPTAGRLVWNLWRRLSRP